MIVWYWTDSNHILSRRPNWVAGDSNRFFRRQKQVEESRRSPDTQKREVLKPLFWSRCAGPRPATAGTLPRSGKLRIVFAEGKNMMRNYAGRRIHKKREVILTSLLELVRRTPTGDCWNIAAKRQITNRFFRRQKQDEKSRRSPDTQKKRGHSDLSFGAGGRT